MPSFDFKYVVGDKVVVINGQVKGEVTHRKISYTENFDTVISALEYTVKLAPNKSLTYQERHIELDIPLKKIADQVEEEMLKLVPEQYKKIRTDELLDSNDIEGLKDLHK